MAGAPGAGGRTGSADPLPATVTTTPSDVTRRTREFPVSATTNEPDGSAATEYGNDMRAAVAGPPSPVKPCAPIPATTVSVRGRNVGDALGGGVTDAEADGIAPRETVAVGSAVIVTVAVAVPVGQRSVVTGPQDTRLENIVCVQRVQSVLSGHVPVQGQSHPSHVRQLPS